MKMRLALQGFVQYPDPSLARDLSPVINLGLILLVWWSSNKLVWDCTFVGECSVVCPKDVDPAAARTVLLPGGAEPAGVRHRQRRRAGEY